MGEANRFCSITDSTMLITTPVPSYPAAHAPDGPVASSWSKYHVCCGNSGSSSRSNRVGAASDGGEVVGPAVGAALPAAGR